MTKGKTEKTRYIIPVDLYNQVKEFEFPGTRITGSTVKTFIASKQESFTDPDGYRILELFYWEERRNQMLNGRPTPPPQGGEKSKRNTDSRKKTTSEYSSSKRDDASYAGNDPMNVALAVTLLSITTTPQDTSVDCSASTATIDCWGGISETTLRKLEELLNT